MAVYLQSDLITEKIFSNSYSLFVFSESDKALPKDNYTNLTQKITTSICENDITFSDIKLLNKKSVYVSHIMVYNKDTDELKYSRRLDSYLLITEDSGSVTFKKGMK